MTEAHLTPNHPPPPPTAHGQQHSAERDDLLILPPFSTYSTDLLIESLLHKVGHEIIQHKNPIPSCCPQKEHNPPRNLRAPNTLPRKWEAVSNPNCMIERSSIKFTASFKTPAQLVFPLTCWNLEYRYNQEKPTASISQSKVR